MSPFGFFGRVGLLLGILSGFSAAAGAATVEQLVKDLKPSVVNIEVSIAIGLGDDSSGASVGTGFVADSQRGLIVTNQHVSGKSPAQYKITFYNGESTKEVRLKYYDAWHDFALLQVDTSSLGFALQAVSFGSSLGLQSQDKVFLIGNNEAQNYTVLYGEVINTDVDEGDRHTGSFQVVYGNRGGSSGSPVFDSEGRVVGLHYKGTEATGFEIRIEYVRDVLERLVSEEGRPQRGDIGVVLDLMMISDAEKNYHLPDAIAEEIRSKKKDIKKMVYVERIISDSPAAGKLEPGDLVLSVDGMLIGDSLYAFDRQVDAKMGRDVSLRIVRDAKEMRIRLHAGDAEKDKIHRFALFGGAVLHDWTPMLQYKYNTTSEGVCMIQAEPGSSLSGVGNADKDAPKQRRVVIEAIDGHPTPNLETFIQEAAKLKNGDDIYLTIRDLSAYNTSAKTVPVTLDLKYFPLKVFEFSEKQLDWSEIKQGEYQGHRHKNHRTQKDTVSL